MRIQLSCHRGKIADSLSLAAELLATLRKKRHRSTQIRTYALHNTIFTLLYIGDSNALSRCMVLGDLKLKLKPNAKGGDNLASKKEVGQHVLALVRLGHLRSAALMTLTMLEGNRMGKKPSSPGVFAYFVTPAEA